MLIIWNSICFEFWINFSIYTSLLLKKKIDSLKVSSHNFLKYFSSLTIRIPSPPPPSDAFNIIGKPIYFDISIPFLIFLIGLSYPGIIFNPFFTFNGTKIKRKPIQNRSGAPQADFVGFQIEI